MHALIIEDEPLIAMSIEDALRPCGYSSFDFAGSAGEAVAAARLHCPDLITSDVQLAAGCGIDAVAEICCAEAIPVVFITGIAGDVQDRLAGHVVVDKPFIMGQIAQAVRRARA